MFDFAWPWAFILLPLPWLIYRFYPAAHPHAQAALKIPFYQRLLRLPQPSSHTLSLAKIQWRKIVVWMSWICLIIALSGPQWVGPPTALKHSGRDIMLAIDLSGSMETPDMQLNQQAARRIEVVKSVAGQFIQARSGDRVGLILFGTRAYLQTPLTYDRDTVQTMLNDATIGLAGPQTAIGDAIGLAVKRLMPYPEKSRALVLLTDGGNNAGTVTPLAAAKLAAQEHIKIYTIGIGTDQILVPGLFGPQLVHGTSDVDVKTLTQIAHSTGGQFFRATDTSSLQQIYAHINELEPVLGDDENYRLTTELYPWPLSIVLLFMVALACRHIIMRRTI